jgi:energy-coupling factor transporter ATP-binding protein EcfA2
VIRVDEPLEFELRAGAPLALVGPNGAGKTVALEAIAGVRTHSQVRVSGGPDRPTPVLAAQYPDLQVFGNTVAEEIGWAASERGRAAGESQGMALELFAELSLGPQILDQSTWALSAGQRRLVQVVAALVTPASLVVVDEPTCGLDPERAAGLGQLLGRAAQSLPLLVATQDEVFSGRIRASLRGLGGVVGNAASTYGKTD